MKKTTLSLLQGPNRIFIWVVFLPLIVGIAAPMALSIFFDLFFYFLLLYPFIILVKVFTSRQENNESLARSYSRYINLIPGGIAYGSDLEKVKFPAVTIGLILLNVWIFIFGSESSRDAFAFFPIGDTGPLQVCVAFFASGFLHINFSHLLGNMFFLWAVGSVVEGRLGHIRYIILYFAFIAVANFFDVAFLLARSIWVDETFFELFFNYHCIGASGAISGIIGIYAIRCYFSDIKVAVPFLLLPFLSFPVRVQGILFVSLFFALNIDTGVHGMDSTNVAHWAHIGGYLGGVYTAWQLNLHHKAAAEAKEHKARKKSNSYMGRTEASDQYKIILQKEPHNIEALEHLLMVNKYNDEKSALYYVQLLEVLVKQDFPKMITLFNNYYPQHVRNIPPQLLVKLANHFFTSCEFNKAKVCLEFAINEPGPWQAKAFMLLAESYMAIENTALAKKTWQTVLKQFPNSPFSLEAEQKMKKITAHCKTL